MYKITPEILEEIAGAPVNKEIVNDLVKYLPEALEKYDVNTKLRLAHFLSQAAHESAGFTTLEEGNSGRQYEGRRDLGNIKRGDGVRYKGRGIFQFTGRYNYSKYGKLIGVDLENHPELAAEPKNSVLLALEYWKKNDLNSWADKDNCKHVTRIINGAHRGLADRKAKLARAKEALKNIGLVTKASPVIHPTKAPPLKQNTAPKIVEKDLDVHRWETNGGLVRDESRFENK